MKCEDGCLYDGHCYTEEDCPVYVGWIPVEKQLPKPGQYVLCYFENLINCQACFGIHDRLIVRQLVAVNGSRWADEGVTYWMELPQAPGEEAS